MPCPRRRWSIPAHPGLKKRPPPSAPANPAQDMFKPSAAVANLNTAPAGSRAVTDAAVPAAAAPSEVTPAQRVAGSPTVEARPSEVSGSAPTAAMPPSDIAGALPAPTMVDPGAPKLEEPGQSPAAGKADAAKDQFKPTGAVPNLATAPARSKATPDAAPTGQSECRSGRRRCPRRQADGRRDRRPRSA